MIQVSEELRAWLHQEGMLTDVAGTTKVDGIGEDARAGKRPQRPQPAAWREEPQPMGIKGPSNAPGQVAATSRDMTVFGSGDRGGVRLAWVNTTFREGAQVLRTAPCLKVMQ